jgi:hypothetical protein
MPSGQIKDEKMYSKLRERGDSKEKSARIANAANSSRRSVGSRGGKSPSYQDWPKDDLIKRAREIGIEDRSSMTKAELVNALCGH